jgi:2-amino-4-hydroxy-6-hydroxymethyldihydropteridine diphosphokinase
MSRAWVGLGSNLGDRERHIRAALEALARLPETTLLESSSLYETEPEGDEGQPGYLNAVAAIETGLTPRRLLWHLLLVESRAGRERRRKHAPRRIDLDLLMVDQRIVDEPDLVLPHPRLAERAFVLAPFEEIAPDLVHPTSGKTIRALLRGWKRTSGVRRLGRPGQ